MALSLHLQCRLGVQSIYPVPFNEQKRLEVLKRYGIVDTPSDPAFDDLTSLARRQFSMPIALVSLVDSDRQWFKSHPGLDASETPRDLAFCAHAILKSEPLIVTDTTADPRFSDNALVTGEPHIRFYAGAPLVTAEGFRLGTFCLIHTVPRPDFTADDRQALEEFARLTMQLLEKRRAQIAESSASLETDLADEARKDLFGLVAHEIRSPIATLISLARVID
jgi:GAF domain-containing protein